MKLATKLVAASCLTLLAVASASAQQGIKRTPLGTMDFPAGYQTVMVLAELAPGVCSGRHTHPGAETAYTLEGTLVDKVDGKPDQQLKAGKSIQIAAGAPHDACAGPGGAKSVAVFVIEKGKPLVTPVP